MNIEKLMNRPLKMELQYDVTNCFSSINNKKKKRFRSAFTTDQIKGLEKEYKKFPYIGIVNRRAIAKSLNIPERAIKIWFQNRRMKEKRDKSHNDEMQNNINRVTLVQLGNDQPINSTAMQSDNDPVSVSITPQIQRTGSKKLCFDNFPNSYLRPVINATSAETNGRKNDIVSDDTVKPPYFQNNTVTSSTIDSDTAEFSIQLLKKYKNNTQGSTERPTRRIGIQKIVPKTRHDVAQSCKSKKKPNLSGETTHATAASTMHQRHTIPQIPGGYVPPIGQSANCYQQACLPVGNILWKPVDPNMPNALNQFAFMPNPTSQTVMQERKCFCNCHGNSQRNLAPYVQENQIPQYIIAVPFHNAPPQFTYPM